MNVFVKFNLHFYLFFKVCSFCLEIQWCILPNTRGNMDSREFCEFTVLRFDFEASSLNFFVLICCQLMWKHLVIFKLFAEAGFNIVEGRYYQLINLLKLSGFFTYHKV
jgi:hypothetical protein